MTLGQWLIDAEQRFGGRVTGVKRGVVSPRDTRSAAEIARGGMTGGDRMAVHGYAGAYADTLGEFAMGLSAQQLVEMEQKYSGGTISRGIKWPNVSARDPRPAKEIKRGGHDGHRMQPRDAKGRDYAGAYAKTLGKLVDKRFTLVELGILRGIGLAIWCDLFPNARVIGLDVDVEHFKGHQSTLRDRGAFSRNEPEVYEYDELADGNKEKLEGILDGDRITVCIDDALHTTPAILYAMNDMMPLMARRFLYFVEDNWRVHVKIRETYSALRVRTFRELTVVSSVAA